MIDFAPHDGNTQAFARVKTWAAWLKRHHAASTGIWVRFFKKHTGTATITARAAA